VRCPLSQFNPSTTGHSSVNGRKTSMGGVQPRREERGCERCVLQTAPAGAGVQVQAKAQHIPLFRRIHCVGAIPNPIPSLWRRICNGHTFSSPLRYGTLSLGSVRLACGGDVERCIQGHELSTQHRYPRIRQGLGGKQVCC